MADLVFYLPIDTKLNTKRFLNILQPNMVIFSRSDLWYNYLTLLNRNKIPTFLVSLSLTKQSKFLKWPQSILYQKCFSYFNTIYCQTDSTALLLKEKFGIISTKVTGNTRIDRILNQKNTKLYDKVNNFVGDEYCVIVGSSLPKDEQIVIEVIEELKNMDIKWLIVPHEINEIEIEQKVANHINFCKYSDSIFNQKKVMYVDFVGGLKHFYRYANFAIVGGGFNSIGIHNILEPAVYGLEIAFGPNHRNYTEALDLIEIGSAKIFKTSNELKEIIINSYQNKTQGVNTKILNYVNNRKGASQLILDDLTKLIK